MSAHTQTTPITHMQLFALMRYLHLAYALEHNIADEPSLDTHGLRFGQAAKLSHQEKQVHRIQERESYTKVQVQGFGMLGTNGALPLHITEAVHEKNIHEKDSTFNDFLDIFHHRLLGLFYKAWLSSEPAALLDRLSNHQHNTSFSNYLSGFLGNPSLTKNTDATRLQYSQFYYSSLLLNQNMPVGNLEEILRGYFGLPVRIEENVGEWMAADELSTDIGHDKYHRLGEGLMIGNKYFDATLKFCIIIGPVSVADYLKFTKGGDLAWQLEMWVNRYMKHSHTFDVKIIIKKEDIQAACIGGAHPLGVNSWLGSPKQNPQIITRHQ